MKNEEVQRLLGGYATNSLTEAERKELFEAAFEDQELFDALQREQALKDLLDDEISRAQVHQALIGGGGSTPQPWWGRWWTWGVAGGALAAVFIVALVMLNRPDKSLQTSQVAMAGKQMATAARGSGTDVAKLESPAPQPPRPSEIMSRLARAERERKVEGRRTAREELTHSAGGSKDIAEPLIEAAPPPPPLPAPAVAPAQGQEQNQVTTQAQAPVVQKSQDEQQVIGQQPQAGQAPSNGFRDQVTGAQARQSASSIGALGGVAGGSLAAPSSIKAPGLTYSVLKRDESGGFSKVEPASPLRQGDAVRLMVSPSTPGYLNLYERDASGEWKRLVPQAGIKVNANTPYLVPEQPIDVKEQDQLRLVLSSEPVTANIVSQDGERNFKSALKEKQAIEIQPVRGKITEPVVVDIRLTGK